MERGLINATNSGENFDAWVVGFYGEWSVLQSDKLTKLPEVLADAQAVRWQSKYGREPTIQQRAWLVHEKSLPPTGRGEGWNWSIRTGPACKAGDHARADLSTAP